MGISIHPFIEAHLIERPPLLLGLSGGPDSMALFHLLLEISYPFEVAHIDHGWREESQEESSLLEKLCEKHRLPFHCKRLEAPLQKKNLEEAGRESRLTFFKELLLKRNLQSICLAHHADDHAETVLKRVFEGASLPKLRGLLPKSTVYGMTLYRPLLPFKKKALLSWLAEKNISYFQDKSNEDPRFLRSRMRTEIVPFLTDQFGKEISTNLCRLGEAAAELDHFLKELTQPYLQQIQITEEGVSLDLHSNLPSSSFLKKVIVRQFFDLQGISLTIPLLESILEHLQKGSCHKKMRLGSRSLSIHRGELKLK